MNRNGSIILGFTFTIMIAASIMFYFKESEIQNQMSQIKRESLIINLDMLRYTIERAFEDPRVVSRTIHAAANQTGAVGLLECLTNPNSICENIEKDLTLVSQLPGRIILDPTVQSNGHFFGLAFKAMECALPACNNLVLKDFICDSFQTSSGSNDCIFRLRTSWRPICPAIGECRKPKIVWMLKLEQNTGSTLRIGSINPTRYYVEKIF
ncbi:MAG: hypothetical protein JNL11_06740 [Bdellovibrionaceae bacterium]|nr:hypothetical protein [Pseudobdellovibrionaceae bacterium]